MCSTVVSFSHIKTVLTGRNNNDLWANISCFKIQDCDLPEDEWKALLDDYSEAITCFMELNQLVQPQEMFTTETIDEYQQKSDAFFFKWQTLNGV